MRDWNSPSEIKVAQLMADREQFCLQMAMNLVPRQNVDFKAYAAHHIFALVSQFRSWVTTLDKQKIEIHVKYPKDWWQAVRERWAPKFWLRRYPVEYHEIHKHEARFGAVCPHLLADEPRTHVEWLFEQGEERQLIVR